MLLVPPSELIAGQINFNVTLISNEFLLLKLQLLGYALSTNLNLSSAAFVNSAISLTTKVVAKSNYQRQMSLLFGANSPELSISFLHFWIEEIGVTKHRGCNIKQLICIRVLS